MSVNFYAFGPGITDPEGLHIGQAAAGWRFLFRAHPDRGLTTLADWEAFIARGDITIQNEYGRDVASEEMRQTMTETTGFEGAPLRPRFRYDTPSEYVTSGGHAFSRRDFR